MSGGVEVELTPSSAMRLPLTISSAGSLEDYAESAWNKLMTVNVASVFHMTRACVCCALHADARDAGELTLLLPCESRHHVAAACPCWRRLPSRRTPPA